MELKLRKSTVRSWQASDAESLAKHANDRRIWLNLRDAFPHPYALAHAHAFIAIAMAEQPETKFAVVIDGQAVGSIGILPHTDVERISVEIGYFLGAEFWGRGIMSEVLAAVAKYVMQTHGLERVYALPYAGNPASCRVLEKAGFTREGLMRRSAIKDGKVLDQCIYAMVRE
jgi:RimJ/RimL family protein N-acetyltransferase